jgi:hypothetical protein
MNWTAAAQSATGNWLSVSPSTGSSGAFSGTAPQTLVSTDARALAPGQYYGRIAISAPNAANSPQVVSVVLNVVDAGAKPAPVLSTSRLVFVAEAEGTDPSSQELLVTNVSASPLTFTSGKVTNGGNWLTQDPANGTLPPGVPARIVVQPVTRDLAPGAYTGSIHFQFSDGSLASVDVHLIVTPSGLASQSGRAAEADCRPS